MINFAAIPGVENVPGPGYSVPVTNGRCGDNCPGDPYTVEAYLYSMITTGGPVFQHPTMGGIVR